MAKFKSINEFKNKKHPEEYKPKIFSKELEFHLIWDNSNKNVVDNLSKIFNRTPKEEAERKKKD